jgi:AraC family transcriptional regulator
MNGYECITGAVAVFEEQLEKNFSQQDGISRSAKLHIRTTAEFAAKSGYSVWHFTRLFSFITGMNPKEYITGRIMSECARLIASQGTCCPTSTLASVAFKAGFDDYETFSRSFRRRFGLSPRRLKESGSLEPLSAVLTPRFVPQSATVHIGQNGLSRTDSAWFASEGLRAEIIERHPFHITGLPFYLDEKIPSFDRMWAAFSAKTPLISGRTEPEQFCQYTAWTTPAERLPGPECHTNEDESLLVLCAIVTDPASVQEPVFTSRIVPGGKFLHCIHPGSIETISDTYHRIYCGFIAESELSLTSCWEYQTYNSDGTTGIYIPLGR